MGGSYARTNLPAALNSSTYDDANQIATWAGTSFTYDDNGNLTADGSKTYSWNARNELTGLSGGVSASFGYDAIGRRRSRTVGSTTTQFLYDGLNPVQELASGTPTANLLTGLGIDEYFTRTDAAGARNLLTDALGSTIALSDGSGSVQTEYTYEPFGSVTTSGSANGNAFGFTGRENDGTSIDYYRARYYDPRLQRFLSVDPLDIVGGDTNAYSYVRNGPISGLDPLGLSATAGRAPCAPAPKCFAQLKYRPLDDEDLKNYNHSFWYVQGSSGTQYIISGGPSQPDGKGFLNVWVRTNIKVGPDSVSAESWWSSELTSAVCSAVDRLIAAALNWANNWIPYNVLGPNSNTIADHLGRVGGFGVLMPPSTPGWGAPIWPHVGAPRGGR
jgi:RHS repeat-associated protein